MNNLHIGLYITYESQGLGGSSRFRVSDYCFDGSEWNKAHDKVAPVGRIYYLKCTCGSNDWTDNGRSINEYECNSCGQFVTITESRQ